MIICLLLWQNDNCACQWTLHSQGSRCCASSQLMKFDGLYSFKTCARDSVSHICVDRGQVESNPVVGLRQSWYLKSLTTIVPLIHRNLCETLLMLDKRSPHQVGYPLSSSRLCLCSTHGIQGPMLRDVVNRFPVLVLPVDIKSSIPMLSPNLYSHKLEYALHASCGEFVLQVNVDKCCDRSKIVFLSKCIQGSIEEKAHFRSGVERIDCLLT